MSSRYITTNASLMAALLEHAGHLSEEFVQKQRSTTSFPQCLRYVVHKFFTSHPDDAFIQDITKSAIFHQKSLTEPNIQVKTIPQIPTPGWIVRIKNHPSIHHHHATLVEAIQDEWDMWIPKDTIAKTMKQTIDELL